MTNNHIGTAFEFVKLIAADQGFNYSHGNLTESANKNRVVYPMIHSSIQNVSVGLQATRVTLNVVVADIVNYLKTENEEQNLVDVYSEVGYTENQNYAHVLQEMYMRWNRGLYKYKQESFANVQPQFPVSMTPFIEEDRDVLAGYTITLNLDIISPMVTDGDC